MGRSEPDILSRPLEKNDSNELPMFFSLDIDVEHECQSPKVSNFEKMQVVIDSEQEYQGPSSSEIDGEECQTPTLSSFSKFEMDVDNEQDSQSSSVDISVNGEGGNYVVPQIGMEFESEDHAYNCYSRYAVVEGFSIRKDFVNKSRINGGVVSRRYTCYRQGYRSIKHNVNVRKSRQETRTGCLAHMTIVRQQNGKFRVTHFEPKHNHKFVAPCTAYLLPSQRRLNFAEAVEADLANNSGIDGVPKLGMGFDSEDDAYEFYNTYAGQVGFSVRKDYVNRSKIDGAVVSRRYTCFREGFRQRDKRDMNVKIHRKETRIGCLAQLVISRQPDGQYRITHFEENHIHELVAASRVHMLRSQRRLVEAQIADGELMGCSELICRTVSDCDNHIDYKSKLPSKCMREMREGESAKLQQFLQDKQLKTPSFFYAIQPDVDDQLTNVFWADTKMVTDYSDFGDVICFDTTSRLQKDSRPFAAFIGINHHKQMLVFGAALLYDESFESYKWVFQTFLEAMSGKRPKSILMDQDAVAAEAIASVCPESHHRICVWHVYRNAVKQLSSMFVDSGSFINDLSSCLFDHEDELDFINAWKVLLDVYGLWQNEWLHGMFECREKWAIAYGRHIFCADIKTALLHENFTENLKKYLKSESDVLQLFKHLSKVVNDWHYKELEANYNMNQHLPELMGDVIFLKHASDVYTPRVFGLLQQEYETCLNIIVNQCTETGSLFEYKVSIYGQPQEYTVTFDLSSETVACNCMKFEFMGVLCSHALKVLDYRNIKILPSQYILKRWTKDARVLI